ncbi:hypothetical protein D3C86_2225710 [compost metagenome]
MWVAARRFNIETDFAQGGGDLFGALERGETGHVHAQPLLDDLADRHAGAE